MKFIISPSKTQKIMKNIAYEMNVPQFEDTAIMINNHMKKYDISELKSIYKSSEKIAAASQKNINNFDEATGGQAIFSYTGSVFKGIDLNSLNDDQISFLNNHLFILSAYYGVLKPLDMIKPYRLDFDTNINEIDLKSIWVEKINDRLKDEEIINLASNEFSSLINKKMININFKEVKHGKLRVVATYAKQARGVFINHVSKNKISTLEGLKEISACDYRYDESLSDEYNYIFIR